MRLSRRPTTFTPPPASFVEYNARRAPPRESPSPPGNNEDDTMMKPSPSSSSGGIATSSSSSSSPSSLDAALSSWSRFDLTDRRPHLDASAQSLLDAKESSLVARRKLGDATKGLKRALKSAEDGGGEEGGGERAGSAAVRTLAAECKSTIRMYQEEIDSITRRCKSAEGAFVQLYRGLHECPDPAGALRDAGRLIEGRDAQVENLLRGMEALNSELETSNDERARLSRELKEREREWNEDRGGMGGGGGELSLAEREELIRLRGEVAEFEVEFRGLKNQDITIRKLEGEVVVFVFCFLLLLCSLLLLSVPALFYGPLGFATQRGRRVI